MKTRQTFEDIRNRKKESLTLRVRMVLWVQVELLACVGLAFLIDNIAHTLNPNWNIPLLLELVIVSVVVGGVMTAVISTGKYFSPLSKLDIPVPPPKIVIFFKIIISFQNNYILKCFFKKLFLSIYLKFINLECIIH